jgi:N-acetylglutamate synthase-like GNAT family acetyltransferase
MERGVTYFVLESENSIAGCVACEKASKDACYLERLAVLPEKRNQGFGKALVELVLSKARELGVDYVSIGIIAEHTELKNWYKKLGFVEGETRKFLNLPFMVIFMSYDLKEK